MVRVDPLAEFSEPTRRWFNAAFSEPTGVQAGAWPRIQAGADVLAVAPTGSGKTLAAFLSAIDRCLTPREQPGVRVLYVSPMKALAVDVERNLRGPLAGIAAHCAALGLPEPQISVGLRTGDTSAAERRTMARRPPDVLITTPESLFLILTSAARSILADVESVIIDEVHAIAGSKRGAHLAVSLARLDHLAGVRVPRIGLSATVRPTDVAARFLGGDTPVEIIEQGSAKEWELTIQVPVEDLGELGASPVSTARRRRRSGRTWSSESSNSSRRTDRRSCSPTHDGWPSGSPPGSTRSMPSTRGRHRRVPRRVDHPRRSWPRPVRVRGRRRSWPGRITAR